MKCLGLVLIFLIACSKEPVENLKTISVPIEAAPTKVITTEVIVTCPSDMVFNKRNDSCIDKYEAPNKKGEYPFYAQTATQAVNYCKSVGKELCTQDQWVSACRGPEFWNFPYGNNYHRGACNDDKTNYITVPWLKMGTPEWPEITKKLFKGETSGSRATCSTSEGVMDLTGNVAEWVREPKNGHGYVVKGGFWYGVYSGVPSCSFVNPAHAAEFASYEFGFRCCKESNVK